MLSQSALSLDDLVGLLDAVFQANERGQVLSVLFLDQNAQPVPGVVSVAVQFESPGLRVELKPLNEERKKLDNTLYPEVGDPRKVVGPQSLEQLEKLLHDRMGINP